jgi:hypothetical protein
MNYIHIHIQNEIPRTLQGLLQHSFCILSHKVHWRTDSENFPAWRFHVISTVRTILLFSEVQQWYPLKRDKIKICVNNFKHVQKIPERLLLSLSVKQLSFIWLAKLCWALPVICFHTGFLFDLFFDSMVTACPSKTSTDFQQTTWHYISENSIPHNHCYENRKSYTFWWNLVE